MTGELELQVLCAMIAAAIEENRHLLFLHAACELLVKVVQGCAVTGQRVVNSLAAAGCGSISLVQVLPCQCNGSLGVLQHSG